MSDLAALPSAGKLLKINAKVKESEALRFLGCKGELEEGLRMRFDMEARLCNAELVPKGVFATFKIVDDRSSGKSLQNNCLSSDSSSCSISSSGQSKSESESSDALSDDQVALCGTTLKLPGKSIKRHLDGCDFAAIMAVTLGMGCEMLLRRENSLGPTSGMFFDACASSLVEQGAKEMSRIISDAANVLGFDCTGRFSPGYGDLALDIQPEILKVLNAHQLLGISITDSLMMVPSKSITAIIGLTHAPIGAD